jgi:DNA-binding IclR family transcriptional regulator
MVRRRPVPPDLAARVLAAVAQRPGLTVADLARALGLDGAAVATAVLLLAKSDALRLPEPPLRAGGGGGGG